MIFLSEVAIFLKNLIKIIWLCMCYKSEKHISKLATHTHTCVVGWPQGSPFWHLVFKWRSGIQISGDIGGDLDSWHPFIFDTWLTHPGLSVAVICINGEHTYKRTNILIPVVGYSVGDHLGRFPDWHELGLGTWLGVSYNLPKRFASVVIIIRTLLCRKFHQPLIYIKTPSFQYHLHLYFYQ